MAKKAAPPSKSKAQPSAPKGKQPPGKGKGPSAADLEKAWDSGAKDTVDSRGGSFVNENVPSGDYIARVASCGLKQRQSGDRVGEWMGNFSYTIVHDPNGNDDVIGQTVRDSQDINQEPLPYDENTTNQQAFAVKCQRIGINTAKTPWKEMPAAMDKVVNSKKNPKAKPFVAITVKNNVYTAKTGKNAGKEVMGQRVYVNRMLPDEEVEELGLSY